MGLAIGGAILGLRSSQKSNHDLLNSNTNTNSKSSITTASIFRVTVSIIVIIPVLIVSILLYRMESTSFKLRILIDSGQAIQQATLLQTYVKEIQNNPLSDPYYKFQAAVGLVDSGSTLKAYELIKIMSESDTNNLYYINWLASYYAEKSDLVREIDARVRIAKLDPWNADNYLLLGLAYLKSGDKNKAVEIKQKIILFAPGTSVSQKAIQLLS